MCITLLDIRFYVAKRNLSSFKLSFSLRGGGGVTQCTVLLGSERSVNLPENYLQSDSKIIT